MFTVVEHLLPGTNVLELVQHVLQCAAPELLELLLDVYEFCSVRGLLGHSCDNGVETLAQPLVSLQVHLRHMLQKYRGTSCSMTSERLVQFTTIHCDHLHAHFTRQLLP